MLSMFSHLLINTSLSLCICVHNICLIIIGHYNSLTTVNVITLVKYDILLNDLEYTDAYCILTLTLPCYSDGAPSTH